MHAKKGDIVFAVVLDSDRRIPNTLAGLFSDKGSAWQCVQEWATMYENSIDLAGCQISDESIGSLNCNMLSIDSPFDYFAIEYVDTDNNRHYIGIEIRTKMIR